MNVHLDLPRPLDESHRSAIDDVNRWRGHCLDLFAKIERSCGEALESMIASGRTPELRRAALFGARVEAVRKGLDSECYGNSASALRALEKLAGPIARRNDIVHGVGKVWIDASGQWLWIYSYRKNSSNSVEIEGCFTSREASAFEEALSKHARSLCDTLRNVVRHIEAGRKG